LKSTKGEYEVFEVGEELVFSDDREKIKEYARERGISKIKYRMSVDNIAELEEKIETTKRV